MLLPSIFSDNFADDLFDNVFSIPSTRVAAASKMMQTDVRDKGETYELGIELPGYKKEDITAELKDGYLTVNAKHSESNEEKENGKYIRKERYTGHCSRSFYVGEGLKEDDIKAKFEDGVLTLEFPKEVKRPVEEEKKLISIS
ncbi:MAG: Hsp20/alpha crystallin family protein [Lachnospiraceae bacterium]|nr:Hsp20/alpha crystallin family protein [Lachnospiraceae bacterium]